MIVTREASFRGNPYRFVCDDEHHASWWTYEDEAEVRDRWWDVKLGDVVLDVGAGFGSYALTALACGASRVVCWAPEMSTELLEASLRENGWRDRTDILTNGAWDCAGWLQVGAGNDRSVFIDVPVDGAIQVVPVDVDVARLGISKVDWLKLDVEGAEVEVLRGALGTIQRDKPRILVENHLFKDPTLKDRCFALLSDCGYQEEGTFPYHAVSHTLYVP